MNVFVKEQALNEVLFQLITSRKLFEEKLLEVIMKQLENQASMFLFNFKGELESHNHFKSLEDLYSFSEEIKDIYSKCINIFYKNMERFKSEEIREILSGIIWSLENILETYPKDNENRIELERVHMVSDAIQQMKNVFVNSIQEFIDHKLNSELLEFDLTETIEELIRHIFNNEGSNIKELHAYSLKNLNLLEKREEGKKYISFVAKAKKHLETYQNIDVDNLKRQIDDNEDLEIFKNIILVIKELYRKLDNKENELYLIINESSFSTKIITGSYNRLRHSEHMAQDIINNEELIMLVSNFQSHKIEVLEQLTLSIMDEMNKAITFSMHELASQSKEIQFLSCHIVESLKQANTCLQEIKVEENNEKNEEIELLKVLKETIKIKYETVKERDLTYLLNKKENIVAYEKQLIDFKVNFQDNIKDYFEKMIIESKEYFLNAQKAFEKIIQQLFSKNQNEDLDFLRSDLLFEIVTLEEIVKYCLPKLKDSPKNDVQRVIDIIESCYKQIEKNISLAKIETIEPATHERFNGKDHEAILVEEQNGYKKGEIISVHTKGYRYKNVPVVRANVVAAK